MNSTINKFWNQKRFLANTTSLATFLQASLLVLTLGACHSSSTAVSTNEIVSFQPMTLENKPTSLETNTTKPLARMVHSAKQFKEVLNQAGLQLEQLPEIDFSRNDLIFVYDGTKFTTGYKLEVSSVMKRGKKLMVNYVLHQPGSNCLTGDALTHPVDLVLVDKVQKIKEETYTKEVKVHPCPSKP